MKFVDQTRIFVKSGPGGNGIVSFRREAYVEFGGPNGGDGGKGGDVIFEAVEGLNTLVDYRYMRHHKAKKGQHGMGSNMTGKGGEDLILKVPTGTQIYDEDQENQLRCIEFKRIKGGKPFNVKTDWFQTMLHDIGQI